MTEEELKDYAVHLICQHATEVEWLSISEVYDEYAGECESQISEQDQQSVADLIATAKVYVQWSAPQPERQDLGRGIATYYRGIDDEGDVYTGTKDPTRQSSTDPTHTILVEAHRDGYVYWDVLTDSLEVIDRSQAIDIDEALDRLGAPVTPPSV